MSTGVWHNRDEWLSLLEELFDPATLARLEDTGLAPGWNALEVGAGRGSVAAWLADRVGAKGRVVATDLDTSLLEERDDRRIEVLRHDVLTDELPADAFDLVHCRAVLVHLSNPERALERMVSWLRPGGVLVAEEPWIEVASLDPDPVAARAVEALRREVDVGFARRLPAALRDAGLEPVWAESGLRFFEGGTGEAAFFRRVLEGACAPLVASGELEPPEVRSFLRRFDDRRYCCCGWPRIGAVGWKPGTDSAASRT
jgi:SAM-dependent methyltransferase